MIRPLLAAVVVIAAQVSVFAQVSLRPERPLSAPIYAPSNIEDPFVRAASDGTDFLVVWASKGAGRVTAGGEVLDVPAILLPQPQFATAMDVVWDGSAYLIGWPVFPIAGEPGGLYFTTVSREGAVDPSLLHIATEPIRQNSRFRLASSGHVFAAAYQPEAGAGVGVTLFRLDGTVIKTIHLVGFNLGDVVARGDEFAVQLDHSLALISDLGDVTGEIRFADNVVPLDVAADSDGFVIAAAESIDGIHSQLSVLRVAADGSTLARIALLDAPERIFYASIAEANGEIGLAWKSSRTTPAFPESDLAVDFWAARLSADLGRIVEKQLLVPGIEVYGRFSAGAHPPAFGSNGSTALLVWSEPAFIGFPSSTVKAMPIRPNLEGPRLDVSRRARDQLIEAVAPNGANFLVLWSEGSELRAGRITPSGEPLNGEGIVLPAPGYTSGSVAASFDGQATVVAWQSVSGIWTLRVMPDGNVAAPPVLVTSHQAERMMVSCATGLCLAAWTELVQGSLDYTLSIARIRDGSVLDVDGVFVSRGSYPFSLASSGDAFLLVSSRGATPTGTILSASRIVDSGRTLSIKTSDFAATAAQDFGTQVIWDGERYVVIWEESAFSVNGILRASRISREGDSLDGDVTSWQGFDLMPVGSPPLDAVLIGRSIVVWLGDRLVMLSADTLQQEQEVHVDTHAQLKLAGRSDGTGIIGYARFIEDAFDFHARRAFYRVAGAPVRSRAVRRR